MIPPDWNEMRLGEVVNHTKGFAFKSTDYVTTGGRRIIRVSDTDENSIGNDNPVFIPEVKALEYRAYELKEGDLILTTVGSRPPMYSSMVGKAIRIPKSIEGALLNQNMVKLSPIYEKADPSFLYSLLKTQHFLFHIECSARGNANQASITLDDIFEFKVPIPPLAEQRKIAEILGCWDKAIELMEKLIEQQTVLHRGLACELLTGHSRLTKYGPSARTSKEDRKPPNNWQRLPLHKVFNRVTRKNNIGCDLALTISGRDGLIRQEEYFKKRVASADLAGYYLLKKGEFAFNRSTMSGYPYGAIKRLDRYPEGVVSTLYLCFGLSDSDSCSDFYSHYFESGLLNREIYTIAQEGARSHGLLNVGTDEFFQLHILRPPADEQRAISKVLDTSLNLISKYYELLDLLKAQKKGLMQQLLTGKKRVKV